MARDLLGVPVRVDGSAAYIPWQSPECVANESPIHAGTRGIDPVIACEVPAYALWTEGVGLPKLEDLLDGLRRQCSRMV